MSGIRGVFAGMLALVALEAVVSTDAAASRTAGLLGDVAGLVSRALDPNLPAIPDRRLTAAGGKPKRKAPNPLSGLVPFSLAGDAVHAGLVPVAVAGEAASKVRDNPAVAGLFGPIGLGIHFLGGRSNYKPTKPAS